MVSNMKEVNNQLDIMRNAEGSRAQAFAVMAQDMSMSFEQLRTQLQLAGNAIGEEFFPLLTKLFAEMKKPVNVERMKEAFEILKMSIEGATVALNKLLSVWNLLGKAGKWIGNLIEIPEVARLDAANTSAIAQEAKKRLDARGIMPSKYAAAQKQYEGQLFKEAESILAERKNKDKQMAQDVHNMYLMQQERLPVAG